MMRTYLLLLCLATCILFVDRCSADGSEWCAGYNWTYWAENYVPDYGGVAVAGGATISPEPTGTVEVPSSLGGYPVAVLNHQAFSFNVRITSVTIPASVRQVGQESFCGCSKLKTVTFLGDCPEIPYAENDPVEDDGWVFHDTPSDLTVYVYSDAKGWPSGGKWLGKKLVRRARTSVVVESFVTAAVAEECAGLGKVSGGNKRFRPGTKVSLSATAEKGAAFGGWFEDGELISETPSFSYAVPDHDVVLLAEFVSAEDDRLYFSGCADELCFDVGQQIDFALAAIAGVVSYSVFTETVSGLPTGVTFDKKNRRISGAPKKKGVAYVTYAAANANGYSVSFMQRWVIGAAEDGDYDEIGIADALDGLDFLETGEYFYQNYNGRFKSVSGLPNGLGFFPDVIAGVPTKPGKYILTFVSADKRKTVKTVRVADSGCGYLKVSAGSGGTVTGGGVYPFGKTVRLVSKPKSGYVFAGWYCGESPLNEGASGDYRTATENLLFTTSFEWREIVAKFVDKQTDRSLDIYGEDVWEIGSDDSDGYEFEVESFSKPTVVAKGLPAGIRLSGFSLKVVDSSKLKPGVYTVVLTAKNMSGATAVHEVKVKVPNLVSAYIKNVCDEYYFTVGGRFSAETSDLACIRTVEGWSLSVSGLPPGFKWDSKNQCFSGIQNPSKAGTYTVTLTARNGRQTSVATATFVVNPLPVGLTGSFNGYIVDNGEDAKILGAHGTVTLTASEKGSLSAKAVIRNEIVSFSADGWDLYAYDFAEVSMTKRIGKVTYWLNLKVSCSEDWDDWQLSGTISGGVDGPEAGLWQLSVRGQRSPFGKKGARYENDEAHDIAKALAARQAMKMSVTEMTRGTSYPVSVTVKEDGTVSLSGKIDGISIAASSILLFGGCNGYEVTNPYALFYRYVKSLGKSMRVLVEFPMAANGCQAGKAWVLENGWVEFW